MDIPQFFLKYFLPHRDWFLPLFTFILLFLIKGGVYRTQLQEFYDSVWQVGQEFSSMGIGLFFVSAFNSGSQFRQTAKGNPDSLAFLVIFSLFLLIMFHGGSVFSYKVAKVSSTGMVLRFFPKQRFLYVVSYVCGLMSFYTMMQFL